MDEGDDLASGLAAEFAEVARSLSGGHSLAATLQLVVDAAVQLVAGCRCAGVLLYAGGEIEPMASSDPLVGRIDQMQVDLDEGPCLDAMRTEAPYVVSDDLALDPRFPAFGPAAARLGVRSAVGLRLRLDDRLGALNLYSADLDAFGVADRAKAVVLSSHCSTAIQVAHKRAEEIQTDRDDLHAALASRAVIGQAQGILMERERMTADEAFEVLRRASQDLNVKLRDIAQRLVDTGEDPRRRARPSDDPGPRP